MAARALVLASIAAGALLLGACAEKDDSATPQATEEVAPAEVVAAIEDLLGEIDETYAAGDAERAAELAAEAYVENYELIEEDVEEAAPDLNEELEGLLGTELRDRIQAGAPQTEIATMISRARRLLQEALKVLEGDG